MTDIKKLIEEESVKYTNARNFGPVAGASFYEGALWAMRWWAERWQELRKDSIENWNRQSAELDAAATQILGE